MRVPKWIRGDMSDAEFRDWLYDMIAWGGFIVLVVLLLIFAPK
jgi:hypothetical protein